MNDSFDPYREWLGIPPEHRPPHHYRLLGIALFESDPDVIAHAADGRIAQIENFQTGKYSELSGQILSEIAAAKACLLAPDKRAEYDRKLRLRLEAERQAALKAASPPAHRPKPKPATAGRTQIPTVETASVVSYLSRRSPKRPSRFIPAGAAVGAVLLVVFLVAFLVRPGGRPPVAPQPKPDQSLPRDEASSSIPPNESDFGSQQDFLPAGLPANRHEAAAEQPPGPDTTSPEGDPGRPLSDLIDPADPD